MRTKLSITYAKLFNIKPLGSGCKFGVKISSKKKDGTYTKGAFLNCIFKEELQGDVLYDLDGFLANNEYGDKSELCYIVTEATAHKDTQETKQKDKKEELVIKYEITDEIPF